MSRSEARWNRQPAKLRTEHCLIACQAGGSNSVTNVRTWATHTVELGDVLARMNNMLRSARRFLIGATVYCVLECPTFAVCLRVVHLEPHLLDNTGPLTRDTAVRRRVFLSLRDLPPYFIVRSLACDTEDRAVYTFISSTRWRPILYVRFYMGQNWFFFPRNDSPASRVAVARRVFFFFFIRDIKVYGRDNVVVIIEYMQ